MFLAFAAASRADEPFAIHEISSAGRTVAAELADLDGDGRGDLFIVVFSGVPPDDLREVRVYYQRSDASLPAEPDWTGAVPAGAAAYDLAQREAGGPVEVVFLLRDRLALLGFRDRSPGRQELVISTPPLLSIAADERGLDRMQLARAELGAPFRFLVPGLAECVILDPAGTQLGRPRVGSRANYFNPPRPGPLISESEVEVYLDFPRLGTGDVDGDGRVDLIASSRHEVRVFLQRGNGQFAGAPDQTLPVGLLTEADHFRASGSVRSDVGDVNGDGRVDLLISHSSGGVFDARSEIRLHLNRGGDWNLAIPDQRFRSQGAAATIQLIDLDADSRPDLVDARIPVSVMEIVELLVTRSFDVEARVHRVGADGRFEERPWFEREYEIGLNLETFRPRGFVPSLGGDFNGDGYPDLLASGEGEAIEVFLGGPKRRLRSRDARQELSTSGRVRFGQFDRDALTDFVLYDPRAPGAAVRIGVNRGILPDTRTVPVVLPR